MPAAEAGPHTTMSQGEGPEEEMPALLETSEIGANGPDGFAQYPKWILPTRFLTEDDGEVDISALYGDRNGRIAYVIATYRDGTTNLVEPIYMMKNQNFPFISDEWGPTALSLIQGDPSIVRLMVFDETGKFVVESTAMNSNVVDTRWVTAPAQSWD